MRPNNYIERGWPVFPVHWAEDGKCSCGNPNCGSPAKHPLTPDGFKSATTDPAILAEWRGRWPLANVAIRTGSESGVVVLDIDADHDGFASLEKLGVDLTGVPAARTGGGGRHCYFKSPDVPLKNRAGIRPGIDFRGEGGYVLAPPSRHVSGGVYEWEAGEPPDSLPPVPEWLLELLGMGNRTPKREAPPAPLAKRARDYVAKAEPATEGSRNDSAFRLAGHVAALQQDGLHLTEGEVFDFLKPWNLGCSPPLSEEELRKAVSSAFKNGTPREVKGGSWESPSILVANGGLDWPKLEPFENRRLPPFPVGALPPILGDWVKAVAASLIVPLDLPGLLALGVVAAAIAGRVRVRGPGRGWVEPANLFVAAVLEPGTKKSPVFRLAGAPILDAERELIARAKPGHDRAVAERRHKQQRMDSLEKAIAKRPHGLQEEEAMRLALELASTPEPVLPRLWCDDVTSEKLAMTLAKHGGRIASLSAEGNVFSDMAGRYQNATDFGVYLKAHSGDSLRVDRVSRESLTLENPCLTCIYAIQPEVLRSLPSKAEFKGKGLLARFLFTVPYVDYDDMTVRGSDVPEWVKEDYDSLIYALATDPGERELTLSTDADKEFHTFQRWVKRNTADGGLMDSIREWANKLCGAVLRIAGGLHLARRETDDVIAFGTLQDAVKIGKYLIPHYLEADRLIRGDRQAEPERLFRYLKRRGEATFSQRTLKDRLRSFDDIDTALGELVSRGYIREIPRSVKGVGCPPSKSYELRPGLLKEPTSEVLTYPPKGNLSNLSGAHCGFEKSLLGSPSDDSDKNGDSLFTYSGVLSSDREVITV